VFRLVHDEQSGEVLVVPPLLIAGAADPERVTRGDPERRPVPISTFVEKVRALLPGASAAPTGRAQRLTHAAGVRLEQGGPR
jgi:hypothetical protein